MQLPIEGYVEVLGIGAHTIVAIDHHSIHFEISGNLFGSLIRGSMQVGAYDVDFLHPRKAKFIARLSLEVSSFREAWEHLIRQLRKPFRKVDGDPKSVKCCLEGGVTIASIAAEIVLGVDVGVEFMAEVAYWLEGEGRLVTHRVVLNLSNIARSVRNILKAFVRRKLKTIDMKSQ